MLQYGVEPFLTMIISETAMQIITPSATPRNKVEKNASKNMPRSLKWLFARKRTSCSSMAFNTENITVDEMTTIGIFWRRGTKKYTEKRTKRPVKNPAN